MIIHNFDPVFIDLGFFQIRWYALAYIAGIIIGLIYAKKIAIATKRKVFRYDVNPNLVDDLISYLIIGIILGGRIGYVLFYNLNYFIENPIKIFFVWEGVDCFSWGPADLSIDRAAHPEHPFAKTDDTAIEHAVSLCKANGKKLCIRSYDKTLRNRFFDLGANILMEVPSMEGTLDPDLPFG